MTFDLEIFLGCEGANYFLDSQMCLVFAVF